MNKEKVLKFLPHRDPFLFIDSVESIQLPPGVTKPKEAKELIGTKITAHFFVRPDLEIFRGHFPNNPVLPGVLQIEMMAQASTFGLYKLLPDPENIKLTVALLSCTDTKFRKPVHPGVDLKIESVVSKVRATMYSYQCKIWQAETLTSETTLLAMADY